MQKQFCVGKIVNGKPEFFVNYNGSYIFTSEEAALHFLNNLPKEKKADAQIYCREISPWVKVGDYYTESMKEKSG